MHRTGGAGLGRQGACPNSEQRVEITVLVEFETFLADGESAVPIWSLQGEDTKYEEAKRQRG